PLQLPKEIGLLTLLLRVQRAELTGREIVEQPPGQTRFPVSPCLSALVLARQGNSQGGQRVDVRRLGALESRAAQRPPTPLEAFNSGSPEGYGLLEPALRVQV